jgi:hypothetical protein
MQNLRDMTEPELRAFLNSLGRATEDMLPGGPSGNGRALFVLVVFDDPGRGRHVSNANRADYIKAMRTTADRRLAGRAADRDAVSR